MRAGPALTGAVVPIRLAWGRPGPACTACCCAAGAQGLQPHRVGPEVGPRCVSRRACPAWLLPAAAPARRPQARYACDARPCCCGCAHSKPSLAALSICCTREDGAGPQDRGKARPGWLAVGTWAAASQRSPAARCAAAAVPCPVRWCETACVLGVPRFPSLHGVPSQCSHPAGAVARCSSLSQVVQTAAPWLRPHTRPAADAQLVHAEGCAATLSCRQMPAC